MATAYDNLPVDDEEFDESQVDFTDLEDQYQVRLDEGLDAFVVIDGLPVVPEDSKAKLVKFVLRKLNTVGKVKEDGVHMPVGDDGKTEGYVWKRDRVRAQLTRADMPSSNTQRLARPSPRSSSCT